TPHDPGTITQLPGLISPTASVRPGPAAPITETRLAIAAIPTQGATQADPAYFFLPATNNQPATTLVASSTPQGHHPTTPVQATAFPFDMASSITTGPHTRAVAVNGTNGGVLYAVAYSLVTVRDGSPVTDTNSALALAHCQHCTTVAVSFQVVLVVGQS